jgi:cytochrome c-type biogenesis protein CcmF
MAIFLGNATIILNISLAIFACCYLILYHKKQPAPTIFKTISAISLLSFFVAVSSQICLIYCYLISDYSVINVYQNSHHLKPVLYKITGSWGNHEGSMLLLITVLAIYNCMLCFFKKISLSIKSTAITIQLAIIGLFCLYTLITSNPFLQQDPIPLSGLGLNPILQDIGLAMHPPMLYIGYLGFSMVFSIFLAGLINKNLDKNTLKLLQIFCYFSFATLTLGIALGSWWAYRELGWGGYWFWDPVENISLMPWICATALIHALKLSKQNSQMLKWSSFLSILTMILCLFGIFLTRSGVLTSVHSFAISANRGYFIILLISIIGGFGLFIMANNLKYFANKNTAKHRKFWLVVVNNYFLITALLVILIGTLYPILLRGLFNELISIGSPYYSQVFNILLVPFLIFFIINPQPINKLLQIKKIFLFLLSLIFTIIYIKFINNYKILTIINLFLAFFAILLNSFYTKDLVSKLAHSGFLLIIIGVLISSSGSIVKETNLTIGENFNLQNFQIKFKNVDYSADKNFISRIGIFEITKENQLITTLKPQLRYYPISDQTTNEASIYHHPLYDLYLVIGTKDEQENYAIRSYFKPLINLIWIGVAMIFFAIFLKIIKNFKKIS